MQIDSFLCGFESTLYHLQEEDAEPKQYNRKKDIEAVYNLIDGKKTIMDIGEELGFSRKLIWYCMQKLKNRVTKIGSRNQSTIYARNSGC